MSKAITFCSINYIMQTFENIKGSFVNPAINQIFTYFLGDYIDMSSFGAQNVTLGGVRDLSLDVKKLNDRFLANFFFKLERVKIGEVKIAFKVMAKELKVTINDLDVWLYTNEDVHSGDSMNADVSNNIDKNKGNEDKQKDIPLSGFKIFIEVKNIKIKLRPCRPTVSAELLELSLDYLNLIKDQSKPSKDQSDKDTILIIETTFRNLTGCLLTPRAHSLGNSEEFDRTLFAKTDPEFKIKANIKLGMDDIIVKSKVEINEVKLILNYAVIRVFTFFYQKLSIFPYTNVFEGDIKQKFKDLLSGNGVKPVGEKLKQNLEKRIEDFTNSINDSADIDMSMQINDIEKSAPLHEKHLRTNIKFKINKINLAVYNSNEFDDSHMVIQDELLEGTFLNLFPYSNIQLVLDHVVIEKLADDMKFLLGSVVCKEFEIDERSFIKPEVNSSLNNSSVMMHSLADNPYKSYTLFSLTKTNMIDNVNAKDESISHFDNILEDSDIMMTHRKDSLVEITPKTNQVSDKAENNSEQLAFGLLYKSNYVQANFEHIKIEANQLLDAVTKILNAFNNNLKAYFVKYKKPVNSPDFQQIENEYYYSNYSQYVNNNKVAILSQMVEELAHSKQLVLDIPIKVFIGFNSIAVSGDLKVCPVLLSLQNLYISNKNLKSNANCVFLKVERMEIMNFIVLTELDLVSTKYHPNELANDWELRINRVYPTDYNSRTQLWDLVHAISEYEDRFSKSFSKIGQLIDLIDLYSPKLANLFEYLDLKMEMNACINRMISKLIPQYIVFNMLSFDIQNITIDIIDDSESSMRIINGVLKEINENLRKFNILAESGDFSESKYDKFKLLNIDCRFLKGMLKIDEGLQTFNVETLRIRLFEFLKKNDNEYMFESLINNLSVDMKYDIPTITSESIEGKARISKKRCHILVDYILDALMKKLPKKKITNQSDEIQQNMPKYRVIVQNVDFSVFDFFFSLNLTMGKFDADSDANLQIERLILNKVTNFSERTKTQMLAVDDLNLSEGRTVSINAIDGCLKLHYIKSISDFVTNLKDMIDATINKVASRYDLTKSTENEDFKSFIRTSCLQKSQSYFQPEKVNSLWETFHSFNETMNKHVIKTTSECVDQLHKFNTKNKLYAGMSTILSIGTISLKFIDEITSDKFYINTGMLLIVPANFFNVYILEKYEISIENQSKKTLIALNSQKDFAIKFLSLLDERQNLNFYMKLDDVVLNGNSKLWDITDNRLKIFLRDFTSSDNSESEYKQKDPVMLDEAVIESFKLHINIFSEKIILDIGDINALEIVADEITLDGFINLFANKLVQSVKMTAKTISVGNSVKLAGFVFWRLIIFIFFKRNFKKVNKSLYRLLTNRPRSRS